MNVKPIVKYRTLAIAKDMTKVDTGNARHNATKLKRSKRNSWSINYSLSDAYYIEILEDGTLNGREVKGRRPTSYIRRTSLVLARYLNNHFNGKPTNRWAKQRSDTALKNVLETSQDNLTRQERNFQSRHKMSGISWR